MSAVPRTLTAPVAVPWPAPEAGGAARRDHAPLPKRMAWHRALARHPRLMQYNRLVAVIVVANLAVLVAGVAGSWWTSAGSPLMRLATIAQANFLLATLPRQPWFVNFVCWLATRPSTRWPLRIRWALGKYYHLGGVHVGAAIAGTMWYVVFVGSSIADAIRFDGRVHVANLVLSGLVLTMFSVIIVMATPGVRSRAHDHFELTHRFLGWAVLALVWTNTLVFVGTHRGDRSFGGAIVAAPAFWMVVATTAGALWPWLMLRRVPITVTKPSDHVAIVRIDTGRTPPIGTTRAISRHPLVGWHQFANIPAAPGETGYRMAVSRAGDWTSRFIDDPPSHVWVRSIPTTGVANVKRLFTKVVYVATGSGIGPALGHLLTSGRDCQLVWVTRDPRQTYGDDLVDEVLAARPDAIVWNTDELGKPDVLRLAYGACFESGAEAVICISNRTVTWKVVHGLEQRGIPAFGPIWDS